MPQRLKIIEYQFHMRHTSRNSFINSFNRSASKKAVFWKAVQIFRNRRRFKTWMKWGRIDDWWKVDRGNFLFIKVNLKHNCWRIWRQSGTILKAGNTFLNSRLRGRMFKLCFTTLGGTTSPYILELMGLQTVTPNFSRHLVIKPRPIYKS